MILSREKFVKSSKRILSKKKLFFKSFIKKFKNLKLMAKVKKKGAQKPTKVRKKKTPLTAQEQALKEEHKKALKEEQKKRFIEKKAYQKSRVYTTIKTGFQKLCREQEMVDVLEDCAHRCSVIAIEASMLASIHFLRLLESGIALPEKIDSTFFRNCVSLIANLTRENKHPNDSPLYNTLYEHYLPLRPPGYEDVGRVANVMVQMLVIIGDQAHQNFVVSTEMTLVSRLKRWLRLQIKLRKNQEEEGDYFSVNEGQVEKPIVKMLLRSCLDVNVEVRVIMNQYKDVRLRPIPEDDIRWMEDLCDSVRNSLVELPLAVSQKPQIYLPFLYKMLRDLERDTEKEFRLYSLLPQKRVRPLNITINTTILKCLHLHLNPKTGVDVDNFEHNHGTDLWNFHFKIKPIVKRNKLFEKEIVTDCMSASLLVSRKKKDLENITAQDARQAASVAFTSADRVVAVDPGRNPIISAVVHNDDALLELMDKDNTHHETLEWGRKHHYHECGFTRRNLMTKIWMGKNEVITSFNALFNTNALTTKTSNLDNYKQNATHVLANLHSVLDFYSSKRFKRLKWKTYIRTQKAYEKIVARLKGGVENTLVIWGNAKFPSSGKGSPAVPTTTLLKKVRARVTVLEQDEYKTSKINCCCWTDATPMVLNGRNSHHLRVCKNVNCSRGVWDRNTSAAINILFLFKNYNVDGKETPVQFRRHPPPVANDQNMDI